MKPRADAKLKTLPDDRQADIAQFARTHSLVQTVAWLGETGLKTSITAVSEFLRWYAIKQEMARAQSEIHDRLADIIRNDPTHTAERLSEVGQVFFALTAIEKVDPKAWYLSQTIRLRRAQLSVPKW